MPVDNYISPYVKRVCRDCGDRKIGCHAECERYIKEQAEREEKLERLRFEKSINDAIGDIAGKNKGRFR